MGRRTVGAVLAVALALGPGGAPAAAAAATAAARAPARCDPGRGTVQLVESWAQRRLAFTSVWPLTRGAGVTVALIDSGVDPGHPQLRGVRRVDLTGTGELDCVGHGTAVAGIIAGAKMKGVPFSGVAPDVKLISIKQTNDAQEGEVGLLARGITEATRLGARVINVSIQAADVPDLRQAVEAAVAQDVLIVAAAGNTRQQDASSPAYYPAAYPGVLSVGAAGPDGGRADYSSTGAQVSVLAPGEAVTSTWPGGAYHRDLSGTSYAAPFVAGVAALVRARHPGLSAAQVRRRIEITADGGSGGGTGAGMVNPLLAVSAILPSEEVALAPRDPSALPADAVSRPRPPDRAAIEVSTAVAVAALAVAALVTAAALIIPAGRRRGWRPGRVPVRGD
ncbi:hypothetical protein Sru01_33400 [Sphaerisporangium rufum]|uniref:Peptidase S8/S53 domain-containing protein n=1 Tax=Sphaerisporangium rufum TaxID=1381558 RepID=A0A919V1Z3_9ACTN|nr:type VII secretion-associated serine protease mycosin [Sphaerisporangium rufum]GII78358.1 hypothetical protein Sru01_33400 [Sphaerisporangium rufum]